MSRAPVTVRACAVIVAASLAGALTGCAGPPRPSCADMIARRVLDDPTAVHCSPPRDVTALPGWVDCVLTAIREERELDARWLVVARIDGVNQPYVVTLREGGIQEAIGPCPRIVIGSFPGPVTLYCGMPEYNGFLASQEPLPFPHRDDLELSNLAAVQARISSGTPPLQGRLFVIDFPGAIAPSAATCRHRALSAPATTNDRNVCGVLGPPPGGTLRSPSDSWFVCNTTVPDRD